MYFSNRKEQPWIINNPFFDRLLEVLLTGRGSDGKKKEIVVCPDESDFSFDRLKRKDAIRLLDALKSTKLKQICVHLSAHCDETVPRRFRKLFRLRGECKVGIIRRKKKKTGEIQSDIIYISPLIFNPHFVRDGKNVSEYIEVIKSNP
jgi:hypothetical protein